MAPLQQLIFELRGNSVRVSETKFGIKKNGSISTNRLVHIKLGYIPIDTFRRLAANPLIPSVPPRNSVPLTKLCVEQLN